MTIHKSVPSRFWNGYRLDITYRISAMISRAFVATIGRLVEIITKVILHAVVLQTRNIWVYGVLTGHLQI